MVAGSAAKVIAPLAARAGAELLKPAIFFVSGALTTFLVGLGVGKVRERKAKKESKEETKE